MTENTAYVKIIDLIEGRSGATHLNAKKMEEIVKDEGIVS